jgi:hypothetical protein
VGKGASLEKRLRCVASKMGMHEQYHVFWMTATKSPANMGKLLATVVPDLCTAISSKRNDVDHLASAPKRTDATGRTVVLSSCEYWVAYA